MSLFKVGDKVKILSKSACLSRPSMVQWVSSSMDKWTEKEVTISKVNDSNPQKYISYRIQETGSWAWAEEWLVLVNPVPIINPLDFKIRGHINGIKYPCLVDIKYDGITVIAHMEPGKSTILQTDTKKMVCTSWKNFLGEDKPGSYLAELVCFAPGGEEGKNGELYKLLEKIALPNFYDYTTLFIFDVLKYDSENYADKPLVERKMFLEAREENHIILMGRRTGVESIIAESYVEVIDFADKVMARGYEGVVVKNLNEPFNTQTWVKIKKEEVDPCLVTKVEDTRFEVSLNGKIVGVRKIYPIKLGEIVMIRHNGITSSGSLKNPVHIKP